MRFSMISLGALMLASTAPAMAQDETEPAPAITISASATLVSDYRFRGISQTDKDAAIQAGLTISHESGFYVTAWTSTVDDYVTVHGTPNLEVDLIAGFKKTFGGATIDAGVLYYLYPGNRPDWDSSASNFFEPYASVSYAVGPVTAKASVAYAPKQKALAIDQGLTGLLPKEDNVYVAGDLSASIPDTPIGLTAHVGHTFGPSWLSGPTDEYTDWSLGATVTQGPFTLGLQYVDTDTFFITPSGKDAAKGGLVGSLGVSFTF